MWQSMVADGRIHGNEGAKMIDTIAGILLVVFALAFCAGSCWITAQEDKMKRQRRERRKRIALQVDIIQFAKEPEIRVKPCCTSCVFRRAKS